MLEEFPPGHQNGENFHFHAWLEGRLPEILKYEDAELPNSTIRINAPNDSGCLCLIFA